MIVLDEHLKKGAIADAIRKWYPGGVSYVTDLRPGSIIKDEAIVTLIRTVSGALFATLDWNDEWLRQLNNADRYCIVSFSISASKSDQIPDLLRRVLNASELKSRAHREGKVIRVSGDERIEVLDSRGVMFERPL